MDSIREAIIIWVTTSTDDPEAQWCEIESPEKMPNGMVYAAMSYACSLFESRDASVDDE